MSNDESLIYVLVSWVFHNLHFRNIGKLKMRFQYIRQWGLLKKILDTLVLGLEISANCHLFLIVNSDCKSSNTRIKHSRSSKSMSNDESVIYVLVSWVLHNVHFRHFASWKCDFCSFVNGSYYVNDFGYTCIEIIKISHTTYSSS